MVGFDVIPVASSCSDEIGMHSLAGPTAIEKIVGGFSLAQDLDAVVVKGQGGGILIQEARRFAASPTIRFWHYTNLRGIPVAVP
jgi:hypothetical protein